MRYLVRAILIVAFSVGGVASAQQQYLPINRLIRSRTMRAVFRDAFLPARPWTVELRRGDDRIAYGAIVAADGLVVTKLSEVQSSLNTVAKSLDDTEAPPSPEPSTVTCRLSDGRSFPVTLVAENPPTDLALVRIPASDLPTIEWANAESPELGRWLISATSRGEAAAIGIISSKRRRIPEEKTPGILGVRVKTGDGPAEVEEVFEESPAALAGLTSGDVIERLGATDIRNGQGLIRFVKRHQPGDVVQVTYRRGDESKTIDITLSHPFGDFLSQFAQQVRMGGELSRRRDGFDDVFSQDGMLRPEDCGGPVVDLSGRAVGLNIARAGRTETLVLPADVAQKAISEMLSTADVASK